jgi:hypothetical protein
MDWNNLGNRLAALGKDNLLALTLHFIEQLEAFRLEFASRYSFCHDYGHFNMVITSNAPHGGCRQHYIYSTKCYTGLRDRRWCAVLSDSGTQNVFRARTRAFFVHGFAKNEKDNVEQDELAAMKKLASELLGYDDETITQVVASGTLVEVTCDEKTIP